MSTQTEITRLQTARNTIRTKCVELGIAASTAKLDVLATAVDGIENRGAVQASVQEGDTYTIPKGYHNGSGTVSGVSGGGSYNLQSKTVTPTKAQQNITPDSGYYGLSDVTVAAIPEAYQDVSSVTAAAGDVLATKVFVDAEGAVTTGIMVNNGAVSKTLDAAAGNQSYMVPAGYHNGAGKVQITLEQKSATPTAAAQTVAPSAGKVLSKVTVAAIPAQYGNTADATALAAQLLADQVAYGYNSETGAAVKLVGTMPDNGAISASIDGLTAVSYTIPAGYTSGGTVTLSNDIETALAAI
ncbi:MAG: hypothetical protein KH354_00825 [Clostridiales bacterium]|nr:hypothetical protein [Clostridiales bacterium]